MLPRILSATLLLVGGAGMLANSLVSCQVLSTVAEAVSPVSGPLQIGRGPITLAMVGGASACLFALGALFSAVERRTPTLSFRILGLFAIGCLTIAILLVGFGNTILTMTFARLASAEVVEPAWITEGVVRAWLPMLVGAIFVLGAALCLAAGNRRVATDRPSRRSLAQLLGAIVAIGSSALLGLAVVWNVASVASFVNLIEGGQSVDPTVLASSVSGVFFSTYLLLLSLVGFDFTWLLGVMAPGQRSTEKSTTVQSI